MKKYKIIFTEDECFQTVIEAKTKEEALALFYNEDLPNKVQIIEDNICKIISINKLNI